ncbi:helix-turn-helix domain-containing protein [Lentzea sp. DG1S-22]|uniref:ArsR/SmtB family transcription factor n=1 Tax=Lentzea sp. DG1S-22 TaxID=3108822 RepID=UPI002E79F907|nr:helix-turn-helix domain-containing protein [Lentzea sp. DG1S-22]WVH82526.1 helix-turn-helix domain-containing protein [Lentzea sp. DG1S-22]
MAERVDPLWEMVFSWLRLTELDCGLMLQPWLRHVRRHGDRQVITSGVRMLSVLTPKAPYFPDFITPPEGAQGLGSALAVIRSTPRHRLREEFRRLEEVRPTPGWTRPLAAGDGESLLELTEALTRYHRAVVEPYGDLLDEAVETDRVHRLGVAGDVEGVLRGMWPLMNWRAPVLEVQYAHDRDLHLNGRGLRLVPSYFCRRTPVAFADPELPPTVVYPLHHDWTWQRQLQSGRREQGALAALLGNTRSAVLAAVGAGATTTELAERLGASPSSVSRHTTVLREAGLLTTQRQGLSVLHRRTSLGSALLGRN